MIEPTTVALRHATGHEDLNTIFIYICLYHRSNNYQSPLPIKKIVTSKKEGTNHRLKCSLQITYVTEALVFISRIRRCVQLTTLKIYIDSKARTEFDIRSPKNYTQF